MNRLQRVFGALSVTCGLALGIAGCVVYKTAPGEYTTMPGDSFENAWSATLGAFADEGVLIVQQDRSAGTVRGTLGDSFVTAKVQRLPDGNIRLEFGVSGDIAANAALKDRIVASYNRRMGR
jgi:hypothetical protein